MKTTLYSIICFTFLVLLGCSAEPPLRVGTNIWPGYEPVYIARENGYFSIDEIKLVEYTSASEVKRALKNNAIDVAALTLDEVFNLASTGVELEIIKIVDVSLGGDALIAQKYINSIKELKGKKIAAEVNAVSEYLLFEALKTENMSLSDVEVVDLPMNKHERAFLEKTVDAVATFEPAVTKLEDKGNLIFSSNDIPYQIIDVLVRKKHSTNHDEGTKLLLASWKKAIKDIKDKKPKTLEILAKRLGIEIEEIDNAFKGLKLVDEGKNYEMLFDRNEVLTKAAISTIEFLKKKELIENVETFELLQKVRGVKVE